MKKLNVIKRSLIFFVALILLPLLSRAEDKLPDPTTYLFRPGHSGKETFDDPTDLTIKRPFKDYLPPEIRDIMTFDPKRMKKETAELLGYTAPELVGKIAPEIKPGKYTYKDLEKYPGLKELFPPLVVKHIIKPGGPPLVGNIPEFEIIPTRQFHYNLPLIEATRRNLGKTKLDKDGYIAPDSWEGGFPFPRPTGEFKAQQVFYNFERRSMTFDECWSLPSRSHGFDKNLKMDKISVADVAKIRWKARTLFPPYGWFDERAKKNNEFVSYSYIMSEPRSQRGMVLLRFMYDNPEKPDPSMIYLPSMRRIRKLAATDTQDPTGDMTYDDQNMLLQKITPNKYPYKFDIIEDREYLMFYSYGSLPTWCDSKNGYALRNVIVMRRPVYVLQMTQLDPNYVYSKRIYYIDKELWDCLYNENYDQKGQLYRAQYYASYNYMPEGFQHNYGGYAVQRDYLDRHSSLGIIAASPAPWSRSRFSIQGLIKRGK